MKPSLILAALLCCSCVATSSDLDRLDARLQSMESAVDAGDCAALKVALSETRAEVASVASEVDKRPGLWSRFALEIILATVGVTVPTAMGATNVVRNRARAKRGEPVAVPKAPKQAKAT